MLNLFLCLINNQWEERHLPRTVINPFTNAENLCYLHSSLVLIHAAQFLRDAIRQEHKRLEDMERLISSTGTLPSASMPIKQVPTKELDLIGSSESMTELKHRRTVYWTQSALRFIDKQVERRAAGKKLTRKAVTSVPGCKTLPFEYKRGKEGDPAGVFEQILAAIHTAGSLFAYFPTTRAPQKDGIQATVRQRMITTAIARGIIAPMEIRVADKARGAESKKEIVTRKEKVINLVIDEDDPVEEIVENVYERASGSVTFLQAPIPAPPFVIFAQPEQYDKKTRYPDFTWDIPQVLSLFPLVSATIEYRVVGAIEELSARHFVAVVQMADGRCCAIDDQGSESKIRAPYTKNPRIILCERI